jgi:hypothetical protein
LEQHDVYNQNAVKAVLDKKISSSTHSILNTNTFDELELNAILLTLFYETKMNQTSFASILETIKLFTNTKLPKSFNSCATKLLNIFGEKIEYSKLWYCVSCKKFVVLRNQYDRSCKTCLTRYILTF